MIECMKGFSLFTFVKFLLPILWWVVPGWSGTNHHCIHQEQPGLTAAGAASDGGTWCMCTCWYYLVQGFSTHSWNPLQVLLMYSIYGQQKRRRVSPRHENFEEESHGACNTFLQKSGVRVHSQVMDATWSSRGFLEWQREGMVTSVVATQPWSVLICTSCCWGWLLTIQCPASYHLFFWLSAVKWLSFGIDRRMKLERMLSDCACVHSYAASHGCTGQAMVDFLLKNEFYCYPTRNCEFATRPGRPHSDAWSALPELACRLIFSQHCAPVNLISKQ